MALPNTTYDSDPIRPGAAPQLDLNQSGLSANQCVQPVYHRLTKALVGWLRYHFGTMAYIEQANLTGRVYTPADQEKSPIFIGSLAEWKPTNTQQRPALLVDRLDQDKDMPNRPIGDQFQGVRTGWFGHFMVGNHVVHVIGGREGEAEDLALEVWRELSRFAQAVREKLNLLRLLPVKIGKRVQLGEEYKETYTVPIIITYGYQEVWRMTPLDEAEINAITVSLS